MLSDIRPTYVRLAFVAFILHLIWENTQAPLYVGYVSFWQHFPHCLLGTIGDVAITLLVYWTGMIIMRREWKSLDLKQGVLLAAIGFGIGLAIEAAALQLGLWQYTASMPHLPSTEIGLYPTLQMTILLPLSLYLAQVLQYNNRTSE